MSFIYQKQGNGKPDALCIADLIPFGRENAISRKSLVNKCILNGLVEEDCDADRKMRKLIEKARLDYVILNNSDGKGYYRPCKEEMEDLQKYIRQEKSRALSSFRNIKLAQALYDDYVHERGAE